MTLEDLGNIGDFVGSIGVMASLVYLAVQIRRDSAQTALQTKAIHSTAFQNLIDHHTSLQMQMIGNPDLNEAVRKAFDEPHNMTAEEVRLHLMFRTQQMRSFYNAYHLYESGLVDFEHWKVLVSNIKRAVNNQPFTGFWREAKNDYPASFRAEIESHIENSA